MRAIYIALLTLAAVATAAVVGGVVWTLWKASRVYVRDRLRWWVTSLLAWTRTRLDIGAAASAWHAAFRDLPLHVPRSGVGTHPNSARARSVATEFIFTLFRSMGKAPYVIQQSKSDQRNAVDGMRTWFWSKDVKTEPAMDDVEAHHAFALVDVDYYVDMPEFLARVRKPVVLYSQVVTDVAGDSGETSWRFDGSDLITFVTGGATFRHGLWDYGPDTLVTKSRFGFIPWRSVHWQVERRKVSDTHQLILLVPIARWTFLWAWLSGWLESKDLSRLDPRAGAFNVLEVCAKTGGYLSIARQGAFTSVRLPLSAHDALRAHAAVTKIGSSPHAVIRAMGSTGNQEEDFRVGAVVCDYIKATTTTVNPMTYDVEKGLRVFDHVGGKLDDDAKPAMEAFMEPLLGPVYTPAVSRSNEEAGVRGRVTKFSDEVALTQSVSQWMGEFVDLLVPDRGVLYPYDEEETAERQPKPSQQRILWSVLEMAEGLHDKLKSFIKREPYAVPKDPRLITMLGPKEKVAYAGYVYAISDLLKEQQWYVFGCKPEQVAEKVASLCSDSNSVFETDFSRFDGHYSRLFRLLERMVLLKAFPEMFHANIIETHQWHYDRAVRTMTGVGYDLEARRASGEMGTSVWNSVANKFVSYCAARYQKWPPGEAFALAGLYGGDDGLVRGDRLNAARFVDTSLRLGQVLDLIERKPGKEVNFLSRVYGPAVWTGSPDSMAEPLRALRRFHVAVPNTLTPMEKFTARLSSIEATDSKTPIFRQLIQRAKELGWKQAASNEGPMSSWWAGLGRFPQNGIIWMDGYFDQVCSERGIDFSGLLADIESAGSLEELMALHGPVEETVNPPGVVVNGEVALREQAAPEVSGAQSKHNVSKKTRQPRSNGKGKEPRSKQAKEKAETGSSASRRAAWAQRRRNR